jgi:ABC-type spermidine/putrescine transport system permease subunit II
MKTGLFSVILAGLGIILVMFWNYQILELFRLERAEMRQGPQLAPTISTTSNLFKVIPIIVGTISLLLGIHALRSKRRFGLMGVVLSIILIILPFVPIWFYLR